MHHGYASSFTVPALVSIPSFLFFPKRVGSLDQTSSHFKIRRIKGDELIPWRDGWLRYVFVKPLQLTEIVINVNMFSFGGENCQKLTVSVVCKLTN